MNNSINDCKLLELNRFPSDRLGNLTAVESTKNIPFTIKRLFYIYDVPGGENRGGHAHKITYQFIVAVSGSFFLTIDDGKDKKTMLLNRPYTGILIPPGIWVTLDEFSSGAVALVLTSEIYEEEDYIKNYQEFLRLKN